MEFIAGVAIGATAGLIVGVAVGMLVPPDWVRGRDREDPISLLDSYAEQSGSVGEPLSQADIAAGVKVIRQRMSKGAGPSDFDRDLRR